MSDNQVDGRLLDRVISKMRSTIEQAEYSNVLLASQLEILQEDYNALSAKYDELEKKTNNDPAPQ